MANFILVKIPRAPILTPAAKNKSALVLASTQSNSPLAVNNSNPNIAVAKFPFLIPEPWVEVAQEPPTEIWGSDAKLCNAQPWQHQL